MLSRIFRFALVFAMLILGPVAAVDAQSTLSVNITSPNGGEVLTVGQVYRITWEASPEIDVVTLGYKSCPSCLGWIASTIPNTGYYDWTVFVGNTINTQFTIEIIAYDSGVGQVIDYSDAAFTVLPASTPTLYPTLTSVPTLTPIPLPTITPTPLPLNLKVTTPNGGEVLMVGQTYQITWQSSPELDTVSLGYQPSSCPSCLEWIAYNIPNTGYYDWTVFVGNTTNTQFHLRLIAYDTGVGQVIDYSDSPFTVVEPQLDAPTLITPINGRIVTTVRPAFDWQSVEGATSYVLQVSTTIDFVDPLVNLYTTTSFHDNSKLPRDVVLYWRVRALGQINPSDWSLTTFRIK
jgi:hypothetical protein